MYDDDGITLITCSGISNTGKLTTKTGEMLLQRCPGMIEHCISCRTDPDRLQIALSQAETIVVLDGCSDWCGRKKVQEQGFNPDLHLIATECGIVKNGMEEPRFDEIEHLTVVIRDKLR
ncbi:MAG: putative zinc-binding protein [Methanospirillum sp.]|uniref:putative zinc-binding protein n=1 Tax=Methanospirillum sp. TaxID=45200 RepID=UPI002370876C|nr:putative zinc-binding protein [Methanospirillum sp.]MDD1728278.1 putative zinc-binding protein [Methanospirillum sp.]